MKHDFPYAISLASLTPTL